MLVIMTEKARLGVGLILDKRVERERERDRKHEYSIKYSIGGRNRRFFYY